MKSTLPLLILALVFAWIGVPSATADSPSAEAILNGVRHSQTQNNVELPGTLRKGRKAEPMVVRMNGPQINFFFPTAPSHLISLDLRENNYKLKESIQGGALKDVPLGNYGRPIRNTDVNYEDLSMAFLYWPNAEALGEGRVGERLVWKVRVRNPKREGPYSHLTLWVDQNSGGLMKLDAYNSQNQLIKEMIVLSVRNTDQGWMLKQMRVRRVDPKTGRTAEPTYLDFKEPS